MILSTLGTTNGTILTTARLIYGMSTHGHLPRALSYLHPQHQTPSAALLFQAAWASLLVLSGTFDTLTDMLIVVSWAFYALGAIGIFILRRKFPDAPRPWRVPGYPVVPLLFAAVAAAFVAVSLAADITAYLRGEIPFMRTVSGIALTASGIPLYLLLPRRQTVVPSVPRSREGI
ncbi:MAG: APC family permease [Candidatus Kapabacteria bacterium]|nr:APC family permease [Candidatus Kapabacteria bacterium]MDW8012261.1 APC family permease [Bacteroidota bacterium]